MRIDWARSSSMSAMRERVAREDSRALSIRMATLGERTRIAREIHDNVGHLLTRAIMQAQAGKTVAKATNDTVAAQGFATLGATLDDAMTMVRRSVLILRMMALISPRRSMMPSRRSTASPPVSP